MTKKNFFLDQHGCAKNQVDAEIIISLLKEAGWNYLCYNAENADLIIVNSCAFIQSAKKESIDAVFAWKKKFPQKKILLAGCLAQRYKKKLLEELHEADGIFGNADLSKIAQAAKNAASGRRVAHIPCGHGVCCAERNEFLSFKNSAYVKISEGCSNHCAFCAIPLIRGELRCRDERDIILEIKSLLKKGFFEINLVGQDLAAYSKKCSTTKNHSKKSELLKCKNCDENSFLNSQQDLQFSNSACAHSKLYNLLMKISALKGNFWIRLLYIHPDHFPLDILNVIKNDKRILPYFDIPFQTGDDDILHAMNRKNGHKKCESLVKEIRSALPDAAFRTTFLTGFPGETDTAFLNTLSFAKKIRADWAGAFCFSREEETPAYFMKGRVPKKIAEERKKNLLLIQEKISAKKLLQRVGKEYDVLIEEIFSQSEDAFSFALGRAWFQAPEVDGCVVLKFDANKKNAAKIKEGSVVRAKAVAARGFDIEAMLAE